jgi:hypothetical protein
MWGLYGASLKSNNMLIIRALSSTFSSTSNTTTAKFRNPIMKFRREMFTKFLDTLLKFLIGKFRKQSRTNIISVSFLPCCSIE